MMIFPNFAHKSPVLNLAYNQSQFKSSLNFNAILSELNQFTAID